MDIKHMLEGFVWDIKQSDSSQPSKERRAVENIIEDHFDVKDLKDNSKQQGGKKILLSYFSSQREKFAPDSETNLIPSSSKHLLKGQQPDDTASRSAAVKTQPKKPLAFKLLSYAIGFFIKSFKERRNVGCSNQRRPRRTTGASKGVYGCATSSPRPKAALPPK
jgi:hypothetical protein